jgi:hypothetical protein
MRTPREEVTQKIINVLSDAYEDEALTADQWANEHRHNAERVLTEVWEYIEPFVVQEGRSMTFDYGMLKHTLHG